MVVEIIAQPRKRRRPLGKIVDILGDQLTPGMEVELAIRSHNLPFIWPVDVMEEAKKVPMRVSTLDLENRIDLTHLTFVTIDGEDAKDFDDAIFCQRLQDNQKTHWQLLVAIADVAHYVHSQSAVDKEAHLRGNSVYFPNKVLPMLPESLSNGLCSLKAHQDRFTIVCDMKIDAQGQILSYQFYEALIRSQARLTYTEVADMLSKKSTTSAPIFFPHIKEFHNLFKKLSRQRQLRGAIEFETTETKIIFETKGKIERIISLQRNDAHRMIEEAMLLANVCAARFLLESEIVSLYRVHQGPEEQRLSALRDFLKPFGLRLSGGNKPKPKDYAKLLSRIAGRPDFHILQTVLLRSLRQAVYSVENTGHFGLAYDAYTHFTSPIRRFPDLLVHRAIKHLIHKRSSEIFPYDHKIMRSIGEYCSMTERRADLATRDAVDWLKCEYMLNKLGQIFTGIISDVVGFGVFVELDNIYVQGLLHVTSLPNDYYRYDATNHLLQGRRSGKTFRLGDPIEVLVARVDMDQRTIDFELVEETKQ